MGFCGGDNDDDRIPLWCPWCGKRHVDEGEFATRRHHTHRCVDDVAGKGCGREWRFEEYVFGVGAGPLEPPDAVLAAARAEGFAEAKEMAANICAEFRGHVPNVPGKEKAQQALSIVEDMIRHIEDPR